MSVERKRLKLISITLTREGQLEKVKYSFVYLSNNHELPPL